MGKDETRNLILLDERDIVEGPPASFDHLVEQVAAYFKAKSREANDGSSELLSVGSERFNASANVRGKEGIPIRYMSTFKTWYAALIDLMAFFVDGRMSRFLENGRAGYLAEIDQQLEDAEAQGDDRRAIHLREARSGMETTGIPGFQRSDAMFSETEGDAFIDARAQDFGSGRRLFLEVRSDPPKGG